MPLSIDRSYPRWRRMERDLTRYYEECASSAPARFRGKRRKSYCAGVAWKRLKMAGRYRDYPGFGRAAAEGRENPLPSKTKDALIATAVIAGGFGLILYMISKLPKKAPAPPQPSPLPATTPTGIPVVLTEPTYYVHQRLIDSLDTQAMRCTLPMFVFAGPKSAADALARQLTTRAPIGGSGMVAVSVASPAVEPTCNWRRVCLADGSCVGAVGLG
jgi:hypothetical protein